MANADLTAVIDGDIKGLTEALEQGRGRSCGISRTGTGASLKNIEQNFGQTFQKIQQTMDQFKGAMQTALAGGAIGAAFYFLQSQTQKAVDEFKKIGDEADKLAVTTDFFQTLGFEANKANVEFSKVTGGLSDFSKQLAKLKDDEGDLKKALDGSNTELRNQLKSAKDVEAGVRIMADAIAKLKDPIDQAKLAGQAFGKANSDIFKVLNDGSSSLRAAAEEARQYGVIVDDSVIRNAQLMKDGFESVSKVAVTQFRQALLDVAPVIKDIGEVSSFAARNIRRIHDAFEDVSGITSAGLDERIASLSKTLEADRDAIKALETGQGTFERNIAKDFFFGGVEDQIARIKQHAEETIPLLNALTAERANRNSAIRSHQDKLTSNLFDTDDKDKEKENEEKGLRALAALNKQYYTETKQTLALIFSEEEEEVRKFQKLLDDKSISNEQYELARQHLADITASKIQRLANDELLQLKKIGETISKDLEGAFSSWVSNGKFSAKDLFNQILQDLIKLEFKLQVLQPLFGGAASGFGTGAKGLTSTEGVFASGLSGVSNSLSGIFSGIFHDGGIVGAGGSGRMVSPSTFVGARRYHEGGIAGLLPGEVPAILEEGETVIPKNGRGGKQGGAQGHTFNFNISTPDRESFRESESQIAATLSRAVGRGQRNM